VNILRAAILLIGLAGGPALAQPAPTLSSSVEAGWTSNAQAIAGGTAETYLTTTHTIGLAMPGENFALRGAILFEDTRYGALWRENDWSTSLTLDAEARPLAETALRGSLILSYQEEGQALGPIGVTLPTLSALARLRAETALGGAILGADLAYGAARPGETRFEGGLLADTRTEPITDTIIAGLDIARPIAPGVALAARAQYLAVLVSADEHAIFARFPVSVARLATGFDLEDAAASLSLRGGIDAILPHDRSIDALATPHAALAAQLQLSDALTLAATFDAGAETEDPADGLADWRLKARGSILITPAPQWALEAALFIGQHRSPALDITIETERGGELIARWFPLGGLRLEALARHRRVEGLAPSYEETRIGLRISAAI
jgi:hypothetical protein